jgi:hypothetical protein
MKIGNLLNKLFAMGEEQPEDLKKIRSLLAQLQKSATEIQDEGLQEYLLAFVEGSLYEDYLETEFESFRGELNEVMVEFGNEGYFNEE